MNSTVAVLAFWTLFLSAAPCYVFLLASIGKSLSPSLSAFGRLPETSRLDQPAEKQAEVHELNIDSNLADELLGIPVTLQLGMLPCCTPTEAKESCGWFIEVRWRVGWEERWGGSIYLPDQRVSVYYRLALPSHACSKLHPLLTPPLVPCGHWPLGTSANFLVYWQQWPLTVAVTGIVFFENPQL